MYIFYILFIFLFIYLNKIEFTPSTRITKGLFIGECVRQFFTDKANFTEYTLVSGVSKDLRK